MSSAEMVASMTALVPLPEKLEDVQSRNITGFWRRVDSLIKLSVEERMSVMTRSVGIYHQRRSTQGHLEMGHTNDISGHTLANYFVKR